MLCLDLISIASPSQFEALNSLSLLIITTVEKSLLGNTLFLTETEGQQARRSGVLRVVAASVEPVLASWLFLPTLQCKGGGTGPCEGCDRPGRCVELFRSQGT